MGTHEPVCRRRGPVAETGGARRDRTADLLHAMQALSQLSYGPTGWKGAEFYRSRPHHASKLWALALARANRIESASPDSRNWPARRMIEFTIAGWSAWAPGLTDPRQWLEWAHAPRLPEVDG